MHTTFAEIMVCSIIAAAAFWVLAAAVRWLVPVLVTALWLVPTALLTWALWWFDDVLGGQDHQGVATILHIVTSIGMGTVMLVGVAAISTARSSGHRYGRAWWYMRHHHHHHHHWSSW